MSKKIYKKRVGGNLVSVVDAIEDSFTVVTDKNVAEHDGYDPHNCAGVQSCRDKPDVKDAYWYWSNIYILLVGATEWLRYKTTVQSRTQIAITEAGGKFVAGTYLLKRPSKSECYGYFKLSGKKKPTEGKGPPTEKKPPRRKPHYMSFRREQRQ